MLDAPPHTRLDADNPIDHRGCYCNSAARWTVVRTHSQAERWADTNLRRCGYPTYLPLYTVRARDRVLRTMTRLVERPLWPGYLFVQHQPETSWRPIYETPGVAAMLRDGCHLQYVSAAVLEAVQAAQAIAAVQLPLSLKWAPGAPVAVSRGALAGWPAVITQVGHDMATIAVLMLGALREVAVQLDCLVARDE